MTSENSLAYTLRLVLLVMTYFSDFRNGGISTVLNLAISNDYDL